MTKCTATKDSECLFCSSWLRPDPIFETFLSDASHRWGTTNFTWFCSKAGVGAVLIVSAFRAGIRPAMWTSCDQRVRAPWVFCGSNERVFCCSYFRSCGVSCQSDGCAGSIVLLWSWWGQQRTNVRHIQRDSTRLWTPFLLLLVWAPARRSTCMKTWSVPLASLQAKTIQGCPRKLVNGQ